VPFTAEQFFGVFAAYNAAVWPVQVLLLALALAAVVLALWPVAAGGRIIAGILAALWLWMGIAYHWAFFSSINRGAYLFGALFVAEGVLLAIDGVVRGRLAFRALTDLAGAVGALAILYALIIYPGLGYLAGHRYPAVPTFGLPCPTTIFTFGLLLSAERQVPLYLVVIPFAWSIIGAGAAVALGVPQDAGLVVAGVVGTLLIWRKNRLAASPA